MSKLKRLFVCFFALIFSFVIVSKNLNLGVEATSVPTIRFDEDTGAVEGSIKDLDDKETTLNNILSEYRGIITFLSGIGMLSMIGFFIFNFIALGNSKGNPQERQKAITGLIVSGIATAGLGSVTLIATLFYNMINTNIE